ncbi:tetratricopeptide repeat protein [Streptomyces sp. KLOTTS4A1]|uniref:tetratricopeptide repeat protein n=1 Tax=Streptomyces sp. KLOTTS4A1 TaxID=3390996 RepID=UPI0039F64594
MHPAGTAPGGLAARTLPRYVRRGHDETLAEVVEEASHGHSRMVVLVGSSSTGKTRACWEAVQPLADLGWRLWRPPVPSGRDPAVPTVLDRVPSRTVVWLNDSQHYLGHPRHGEKVAAALQRLLSHPDHGPLLVLGTLWPDHADRYLSLPDPGGEDPHSQARALLTGRVLTVPDAFDERDLRTAESYAQDGDELLADSLSRARVHGRVTQDLAGAPELLRRFEQGSPACRAVLEAAMDARRLGVGLQLPQAFLTDAAIDYLADDDYDQLTTDWAEAAFADLARLVHGKQAPLRRTNQRPTRRSPGTPTQRPAHTAVSGPTFRLADYLDEHGRDSRRRSCPPASFWEAALNHLTRSDDLIALAQAASDRHRLQWAHHLLLRCVQDGDQEATLRLAAMRTTAGAVEEAERLYRRAADAGSTDALIRLAGLKQDEGAVEEAEELYRRAADAGSTDALIRLARLKLDRGAVEEGERLFRQAEDAGSTDAGHELARLRKLKEGQGGPEAVLMPVSDDEDSPFEVSWAPVVARDEAGRAFLDRVSEGDPDAVAALQEMFELLAAQSGDTDALMRLGDLRQQRGDLVGAAHYYQAAVDAGVAHALTALGGLREREDDLEGAEALYRRAVEAGESGAHVLLTQLHSRAGDREGAQASARAAAAAGHPDGLVILALMLQSTSDDEGADAFFREAADAGSRAALAHLAHGRRRAGDGTGLDALLGEAEEKGAEGTVLGLLAMILEDAGDRRGAEDMAWRAADRHAIGGLMHLARARRKAEDLEGLDALVQRAVRSEDVEILLQLTRMCEEAGAHEGAERMAMTAIDLDSTFPLVLLIRLREDAGDAEGAQALALKLADAGGSDGVHQSVWTGEFTTMHVARTFRFHEHWPHGLDPDGSPSPEWVAALPSGDGTLEA